MAELRGCGIAPGERKPTGSFHLCAIRHGLCQDFSERAQGHTGLLRKIPSPLEAPRRLSETPLYKAKLSREPQPQPLSSCPAVDLENIFLVLCVLHQPTRPCLPSVVSEQSHQKFCRWDLFLARSQRGPVLYSVTKNRSCFLPLLCLIQE